MIIYELKEYETLKSVPLSLNLVQKIKNHYPAVLTIKRSEDADGWDITANSVVGSIQIEEILFRIVPKLSIPQLIEWITIAYDLPSFLLKNENVPYKADLLSHEWIIKLFIHECYKIYSYGLKKDYTQKNVQVPYVKGEILLNQTILNWIRHDYMFSCRYDQQTYWSKENEIIYVALFHMNLQNYNDPMVQRNIKKLLHVFGFDKPIRYKISLEPSYWINQILQLPKTRINQHYEAALKLLAFYWKGLSFSYQLGDAYGNAFLLNMNELFEIYIAKRLKRELESYSIEVEYQKHGWLAEGGKIKIIPDIVLRNKKGEEVIIDTKYVQRHNDQSINSNIFQMLAYLIARNAKAGILLYAAGPEREDIIRNLKKPICQWSMKMDQKNEKFNHTFQKIMNRLLNIIEEVSR
jgi:5-methylcytosine-specific restriction enzyme subunit McrC